ncbi:hypothetical protein, partial [Mesorhizobium sp. M7A.F.Ca.ET.027.03.2.1]|uniref:hypothetical protein n=1 Tax=Mesorhizobium sp. M7A.F.Ca.ET.027.03.2.1 TaxID=2496656 RepID=UPI001AEC7739
MAKRSYGFYARLVSSAKHHFGVVSSIKTITINGAGWPISDTSGAFVMPDGFFEDGPAFSGECGRPPLPVSGQVGLKERHGQAVL